MTLHIVSRYNVIVKAGVSIEEYQALAALRYCIREFLRDGDAVARRVGLSPQQYFMMLAIRGLPRRCEATIRTLAQRMALKHHSAVEIVDRLEENGYVRRSRRQKDRRLVTVSPLQSGERLLERVVKKRIGELRSNGRRLVHAINQILACSRRPQNRNRRSNSRGRRAHDERG
jgi:DNA-binding MarR family transcriptional regulator